MRWKERDHCEENKERTEMSDHSCSYTHGKIINIEVGRRGQPYCHRCGKPLEVEQVHTRHRKRVIDMLESEYGETR